ncbi:MAG: barstar family protein [Propionibacteriaceae bacterium]
MTKLPLTGLFDGSDTTGIFATSQAPDDIVAALVDAGWNVASVEATSLAAFHHEISKALMVESWYGKNLDALCDVLRDCEAKTSLVWAGSAKFKRHAPRDYERLYEVLEQRCSEEPAFSVVLV